MTPYLENKKGDRFEIIATMKDKKAYEKDLQNEVRKQLLQKLSKEEIEQIRKANTLSKEEAEKIVSDLLSEKAVNIDELEISSQVNRTYIKKLILNNNDEADVDGLVNELDERFGEEQVDERFAKILNKVFTQLGTVSYEAMPTWGIED